jgi:hypothetical protein
MPSSGMLLRVAVVKTGASEESIASIMRVISFDKLGITLAVSSKWQ